MKSIKHIISWYVALVIATTAFAQNFSIEELERRRVERRAVDAAI